MEHIFLNGFWLLLLRSNKRSGFYVKGSTFSITTLLIFSLTYNTNNSYHWRRKSFWCEPGAVPINNMR